MQVCDFSNQGINLEAVKAAGFGGCISYASDDTAKNWTKSNFDECETLGLSRLVVCEQGAQPTLRGAAGGTHDAQIANDQANALGYSSAATLFYVAEDPSQIAASEFPDIAAYFTAVNNFRGRPIGAYGGWALLNYLYGLRLITKGWMVETWNQGAPDQLPDWIVLVQLVGADTFGLPIDVDDVLQADYGQDPRPPAPSPPLQEGLMPVSPVFEWNGGKQACQVSDGTLWHKWAIGTPTPDTESLSKLTPTSITVPDQTPQVAVVDGQLIVTIEDDNKVMWAFAQDAGAGTWQVWEI